MSNIAKTSAPTEDAVDPHEHKRHQLRRQVTISAGILLFLIIVTVGVILWGKGYRIGGSQGQVKIAKTGILNASSIPKGAQVKIDGHLTTATNNTVNLTPGKYTIEIQKTGYSSWKKDVMIQEQVVSNTDATLFPIAPALQSISSIGVEGPVIDPSGTKLAFRIASQSAKTNGIYVLDMTSKSFPVLPIQSSSTQIVSDQIDKFSTATLSWSPDGKQILASIESSLIGGPTNYLLDATTLNDTPQDVTAILTSVQATWHTQEKEKEVARKKSLNPKMQKMIDQYFTVLSWSPDDTNVLYQASNSATLPIIINPRRIGNNPLYETRDLKPGAIYVYNTKEDVNTKIIDTSPHLCDTKMPNCRLPINWFPDSKHLIYVHDKKIEIVEDDGANMTTLYTGPFIDPYVYAWPDASKIVILTNFNNATTPPTLYTISLE